MVEPLTAEEREAFLAEGERIGFYLTASMLEVRGVERFSHLSTHDRTLLLFEMRKQPSRKR